MGQVQKYTTQVEGGYLRIVALVGLTGVKVGDRGGLIESEENLSHEGGCWVSKDAGVFGNGRVYGDAWVYEDARVFGDAWVYGNAQVYGHAQVFRNAQVFGNALVFGNTRCSKIKGI